ncbi:hypothetical protein [Antribacter gilvus]|uniref:hypothetical protein n=1 Tax=Antribacter gilvus TaxID=2304675 RepID=UPI000F7BA4B3|nr:hypothetical protein [Antribacter gilvus]
MESKTRGIGAYVARLPFVVGHQLSDEHVVLGAFDETARSIVHGALQWDDPVPDTVIAQGMADYMSRALREESVDRIVVVGYGPDGPGRATLLADYLTRTMDVATTVLHVDGGTWRRHTPGGWTPPQQIPDGAVDMVARGRPAPAASRQDLMDSVTPLKNPLFEPLDPDKARELANLSPVQRLSVAVGAMEALAAGRTDDPGRMQTLAHAVTTDSMVREAVIAHTIADKVHDGHVDALVRTFRAAPRDLRPTLALTAAAAAFLAAWHPPLVWGLLNHADPETNLTYLLTRSLEEGAKPQRFRPVLVQAARDDIDHAQQAWEADHPGAPQDRAPWSTHDRLDAQHQPAPTSPQQARPTTPDGPGL